jgi:hypothetical protein
LATTAGISAVDNSFFDRQNSFKNSSRHPEEDRRKKRGEDLGWLTDEGVVDELTGMT